MTDEALDEIFRKIDELEKRVSELEYQNSAFYTDDLK